MVVITVSVTIAAVIAMVLIVFIIMKWNKSRNAETTTAGEGSPGEEPTREEEPYYDQQDYDDMYTDTTFNTVTPRRKEEGTKRGVTNKTENSEAGEIVNEYEIGYEEGDYLEQ